MSHASPRATATTSGRSSIQPYTPNACSVEMTVRDDEQFDAVLGGESYPTRALASHGFLVSLLESVADGRVRAAPLEEQRHRCTAVRRDADHAFRRNRVDRHQRQRGRRRGVGAPRPSLPALPADALGSGFRGFGRRCLPLRVGPRGLRWPCALSPSAPAAGELPVISEPCLLIRSAASGNVSTGDSHVWCVGVQQHERVGHHADVALPGHQVACAGARLGPG